MKSGSIKNLDLLKRSFGLLNRKDRFKVLIVGIGQILLSLLDLLGVALIGVIGALAIRGVSSKTPGDRVSSFLDITNLTTFSLPSQVTILGISATFILFFRTIISIVITKKMFRFLSYRSADLTSKLLNKILYQNFSKIQLRTNQETLYTVTNGVSIIFVGIIGTSILLIADFALLIVLVSGILIVDPATAIIAFVFFSTVAFVMYFVSHRKVTTLSIENYQMTVQSNEKIIEALETYRELLVRNRRQFKVLEISDLRKKLSYTISELAFIPYISKYVIETSVILAAIIIGGYQFYVNDSSRAIATLTIFLAAGTRLAPAVLRIQQSLLLIKGNLGAAKPSLDFSTELVDGGNDFEDKPTNFESLHIGFSPKIFIKDVSYTFDKASTPFFKNFNLTLEPGERTVIVGKSGSGKSTLVDLILGVLEPHEGLIEVSGVKTLDAIHKWPGAIAYVPQEIVIVNGTVRENIGLGFSKNEVPDEKIWNALAIASLDSFVNELPSGLETLLGANGARLSGGQRQRIGIARAMLTSPKLLILDEATSSLDGQTEAEVFEAIDRLEENTSVIMVAHRLSLIRDSKNILYLDRGEIKAFGDFEEIRTQVPDFAIQASLLGL